MYDNVIAENSKLGWLESFLYVPRAYEMHLLKIRTAYVFNSILPPDLLVQRNSTSIHWNAGIQIWRRPTR
jgi:hypothetical protein